MIKMTLTQDQLLNRLDEAFKAAVDISDAGDAILNPVQFDRFVRTVEEENTLLSQARFIKMDEAKVNIDRISMSDRVLYSGQDNSSVLREVSDSEMRKPTLAMNQLVAQEFQTTTGVQDRMLRRIIEKENFTNTLIELISKAAGRDLEELAIFGDTNITYATDDVLHQTDGWVKLCGNKIAEDTVGYTFDIDGGDAPVDMFDAMITKLPKKYLQNPQDYKFYVNWDVADAYRDYLAARNTVLGDNVLTQGILPPYKGIGVQYLPRLARSTSTADNRIGQVAMLQNPNNMVWGVFHEVTIEPDRIPKKRRTDYVLSVEADAHYEDENAGVVAFMDVADAVVNP
jgi:hypothetical protein